MAADSKSVVLAALVANLAIAVLKVAGYLLTGSPSMLSEAYHSFSDTGNQVLLLFGLAFSHRAATREHPFGWGKAEFFYGFVVAMLLFGIAGWESVWQGVEELRAAADGTGHGPLRLFDPVQLLGFSFPGIWVNYGILVAAAAFEAWALHRATAGMRRSMRRGRFPNLWETFQKTKEAAVLTAFTEDILALVGLTVAAVALSLTHLTGSVVFDAIGAIVIGILLMGFALLLAWEQKRLLVGEAMEAWQEEEIRAILVDHPDVSGCEQLRTVFFGPRHVLLTADVVFATEPGSSRVDAIVEELETRIRERFPRVLTIYLETHVASRSESTSHLLTG